MKRFASHYLFLPENGFLKQYVVELDGERVIRLFPLTEEIESVEWLPGVIVLTNEEASCEAEKAVDFQKEEDFWENSQVLIELPSAFPEKLAAGCWKACLLFPFDFTSMQPVAGTRHRLLR